MTPDDRIGHALRALARAEVSRRAPAHLEPALVERFNRQRRQRASFVYARKAAALIVAASTVIGLIALDLFVIRTPLPDHPPRALVDNRAELRPVPPPAGLEASLQVDSIDRGPDRSPRAEPPVREDGAAVGPDADLRVVGGDDVVHLVRIRLPRAMLPTLGVPVIDPDAAGTVNVELLLGNDGLARTIRIVP